MDTQPEPKENPAGAFLEIARQHHADNKPQEITIQADCNACFETGKFRFIRVSRLDEYYRCPNCGALKVIRVRLRSNP